MKILDFFEHTLILTKCLVPCMFELTYVYHINLILIILPSRCSFLFTFLTNLLPTMTSIWLNYNNSFWLFRKCLKTCFSMRKHIYLKNDYQFFDTFKTKDRKIKGNCDLSIKVKFHELEWSSTRQFF